MWQQQGKEEGLQQGKQEGESEIVIRLLNHCCGALSMSLEARVRSLDLPQLESLGEALLDFQAISDLENRLEKSLST
jgi:predicted transposase YdaD